MPLRPCLGCDQPTSRTDSRCYNCAQQRELNRGRRQQRGYDNAYVQERARVLATATHCAHCGDPFTHNNPATGGHRKAIRHGGTTSDGIRPECRRCNYGWETTGN